MTVFFYFHTHGDPWEVEERPSIDLIESASTIFLELVHTDQGEIQQLERDANEYTRTGEVSTLLEKKVGIAKPKENGYSYILRNAKGKRIVFEKTYGNNAKWRAGFDRSNEAFWKNSLGEAMKIKSAWLKKDFNERKERENKVSEQINSLNGVVAVYFGSGHIRFLSLVPDSKPLFPFEGYTDLYPIRMENDFRKTGNLSEDLYLRDRMTTMARASLNEKRTGILLTRMAHAYAEMMTHDQILEYQIFFNKTLNLGHKPYSSFESFMQGQQIPKPRTVMDMLENRV